MAKKKVNKKNKKKSTKKIVKTSKKRIKIKYKNVLISLFLLTLLILLINYIININITNIYISGNNYFTDQQIIELVNLENYPSSLKNSKKTIEKKLEENIYIKSVKVNKKFLKKVYIEIEENRPLFYNTSNNKTILLDKTEIDEKLNTPLVINYIPDTVYSKFIDKMISIDTNIINRISEIKYDPNDVDNERFLLTMNDGNYVYLTINKFDSINNYIEIIKKFNNKKGILYLDSGEYFQILENT